MTGKRTHRTSYCSFLILIFSGLNFQLGMRGYIGTQERRGVHFAWLQKPANRVPIPAGNSMMMHSLISSRKQTNRQKNKKQLYYIHRSQVGIWQTKNVNTWATYYHKFHMTYLLSFHNHFKRFSELLLLSEKFWLVFIHQHYLEI